MFKKKQYLGKPFCLCNINTNYKIVKKNIDDRKVNNMSYWPSENKSWKEAMVNILIGMIIMFILIVLIVGIFTKFSIVTLNEFNEYIKITGKNFVTMIFVIGFLTASSEGISYFITKKILKGVKDVSTRFFK